VVDGGQPTSSKAGGRLLFVFDSSDIGDAEDDHVVAYRKLGPQNVASRRIWCRRTWTLIAG
jgi:hypothetical protein